MAFGTYLYGLSRTYAAAWVGRNMISLKAAPSRDIMGGEPSFYAPAWLRLIDLPYEEFLSYPVFGIEGVGICKPVLVAHTPGGRALYSDKGRELREAHLEYQLRTGPAMLRNRTSHVETGIPIQPQGDEDMIYSMSETDSAVNTNRDDGAGPVYDGRIQNQFVRGDSASTSTKTKKKKKSSVKKEKEALERDRERECTSLTI